MPRLDPSLWAYPVLVVALVVSAVTDIRTGKIYNVVTYPAIAIALIGYTFFGSIVGREGTMGLTGSLAGLAAGLLPLLLVWTAGGIGAGDVKLMAAIGALGGWRFAMASLFCALIVAVLMALVVMFRRRIARRTLARVGRFFYLALTPGKSVDPAAADSPRIPFGAALCIGSALTLIDVALRGPLELRFLLRI